MKPRPDRRLIVDGEQDEDLLDALEASFAIRLTDVAADCKTVGDLHQAVLARFEPAGRAGPPALVIAFYRVRRALVRLTERGGQIGPRTRIADLTRRRPRSLRPRLVAELGGQIGAQETSALGCLAAVAFVAGVVGVGAAALRHELWWTITFAPIGIVVFRLDPGAWRDTTVGDLAREYALQNFAALARAGADTRPAALWNMVQAITASVLEENPDLIQPDTPL